MYLRVVMVYMQSYAKNEPQTDYSHRQHTLLKSFRARIERLRWRVI